jgi:hypothetical protein
MTREAPSPAGSRELRVKYSAQSVYIPMGGPFQEVFGPGRSTQSDLIRDSEIRSVLVGQTRATVHRNRVVPPIS